MSAVWWCQGATAAESVLPAGRAHLVLRPEAGWAAGVLHGPASRPRLTGPLPPEPVIGVVFRPGGLRPFVTAPAGPALLLDRVERALAAQAASASAGTGTAPLVGAVRVLHPIWEASTGWIATSRHGLKARHLAREPRVSLTYWDAAQDVVTVHATAARADDAPTRARIWRLYRTTPPPLGYDPGGFWPGAPGDPAFGLLRLSPTRIGITGLASSPSPKLTWRPGAG